MLCERGGVFCYPLSSHETTRRKDYWKMNIHILNSHPTIRFLTTNMPFIQLVPPFPVLAYEHTPQTKRKILNFSLYIYGIPKEDIVEVGVLPLVRGIERPDIVFAGGKGEPTEESERYIFRNLQLNKPKDRGVTSCFLRFFVRTLHEYRKFKWNHSFF